jgi:hypothetical protein
MIPHAKTEILLKLRLTVMRKDSLKLKGVKRGVFGAKKLWKAGAVTPKADIFSWNCKAV